jgi:splicing factor 1
VHLRIEEINRKLRTGDIVPHERDRYLDLSFNSICTSYEFLTFFTCRSPSPEPIYNAEGKRVNTRDARYRKKLEDERQHIIEDAIKRYPDFRPPADYRKAAKTTDKVYIPAKEFPEINFIGLLIGPRGNTLKKMESESGAKISIRGRGSVKEGKSRTDAAANANQEEDLHCLVTADTEEKVKIAVKLIEKVIETVS